MHSSLSAKREEKVVGLFMPPRTKFGTDPLPLQGQNQWIASGTEPGMPPSQEIPYQPQGMCWFT